MYIISILYSKLPGSLYLSIFDFENILSVKIEAVDESEIETVEFAEEGDPENMDEAGPSTSVLLPTNPGTSSKLLYNPLHLFTQLGSASQESSYLVDSESRRQSYTQRSREGSVLLIGRIYCMKNTYCIFEVVWEVQCFVSTKFLHA